MSFDPAVARTPTSIGRLRIVLISNPADADSVEYTFEVLDQDGQRLYIREGPGGPHLTAEEITQLQDMAVRWRGLAENTLP